MHVVCSAAQQPTTPQCRGAVFQMAGRAVADEPGTYGSAEVQFGEMSDSELRVCSMKLLHEARAARLSQQCELPVALTDLLTIL
jgi:hypothetical protein